MRCLASSFESSVGKLILILLVNSLVNPFVEVAHPNNPDLDLIAMKQFLVKAAELGTPSLVPKHTVYMQLLNSNTRDYVGGS
jgi:hypothetical protein